jgi:hypothetical protein
MTAGSLNGRIHRLGVATLPALTEHICRACGLRHVQPLTLALLRGVLRITSGSGSVLASHPGPLCLCDPCCGADRWLARLSHGLPDEEVA